MSYNEGHREGQWEMPSLSPNFIHKQYSKCSYNTRGADLWLYYLSTSFLGWSVPNPVYVPKAANDMLIDLWVISAITQYLHI